MCVSLHLIYRVNTQMAKEAILALKERNGSSVPAIKKHIEATHPTLNFLPHQLRSALKKGTEAGTFIKVRENYLVLLSRLDQRDCRQNDGDEHPYNHTFKTCDRYSMHRTFSRR